MLCLLDLDAKVAAAIVAFGDPLPSQVITERGLQPFVHLPLDQQRTEAAQLVRRAKERMRFGCC